MLLLPAATFRAVLRPEGALPPFVARGVSAAVPSPTAGAGSVADPRGTGAEGLRAAEADAVAAGTRPAATLTAVALDGTRRVARALDGRLEPMARSSSCGRTA
jgi:hypothetical protein